MVFFQFTGAANTPMHGLRGTAHWFFLSERDARLVVLCRRPDDLEGVRQTLLCFRPGLKIFILPPLEGMAFAFTTVHASIRRKRLMCWQAILEDRWDVILTVPETFLQPLPPPEDLLQPRLLFRVGESYGLNESAERLVAMGYQATDLVSQPGDFAKRGGILDIYSFHDETAYRLEFFDEELEEIRIFDPTTQRGISHREKAAVLPVFEWIIDEGKAATFFKKAGEPWNRSKVRRHYLELAAQIRDRGRFSGYLHWTALFFEEPHHLQQLLPPTSTYFIEEWESLQEHQEKYLTQLGLQRQTMKESGQLEVPVETLFHLEDPTRLPLAETARVLIRYQLKPEWCEREFVTQSVPHYQNDPIRFLKHWGPQSRHWAIVLVCRTSGSLQRMEELIEEEDYETQRLDMPIEGLLTAGFYLCEGHLEAGFSWPEKHLVVISESDIWSKTPGTVSRPKGKSIFLAEFRDLKCGDLVVHLDHGIGRFLGLVEMSAGGDLHEMMAIEYKSNQKLYVHINQLDLVQRFGPDEGHVPLDKLGGVTWEKTKRRVKKAVRRMAGELIKLYAARQVVSRPPYGPDTEWQREFEDAFDFEPTEGQIRSIADFKQDLQSSRPMDRLLVGDVGFGKTEVAMRLAFKAVMEGYQVAVLCPTTVLALQHYHSFKYRFSAFPVQIRWLSRFVEAREAKQNLKDVASGAADILIGTHRILSNDVQFKKLGALIIDEEQRFGVAHKERLKNWRKQVDVLSMSATPIPRTLNMSMSGIRDISILETPPRNRMSITTTVTESREGLIKNAIEFELNREGQIFFVHNRVETMESVVVNLKKIVPGARIDMAHGQMESRRIEKVMLGFMNRESDILVTSTIIENGVDIPNANTMIINRADMFGMSQLYQLRGRIGRSDRPAYAYLLVPPRARMTSLARKRLAALEEFSDLGAGFRIAAMDMELRGAGNLLGGEQAGHIHAIGYETYVKLLEEAVAELKGTSIKDEIHSLVTLHFGSALPKSYIEDANQRLHYYKRLAASKTFEEIAELRDTLLDCYGPLAPVAENLCREHELRLFLAAHRVLSVERDNDRLKFRFHDSAEINPEIALSWIREGRKIQVTPDGLLNVTLTQKSPEAVMAQIRETVLGLSQK